MASAKADEFKGRGNAFFSKGDYENAIPMYTKAIELFPTGHVYYSNRCACYTALNRMEEAIADGEACVKHAPPTWAKAWYRLGNALFLNHDLERARDTLTKGLKIDPNNRDIKARLAEVETSWKKQEEQRKKYAGLTPAMAAKQEGNELYKAARFPAAIEAYSRGLAVATKDEEKIDLLNNRAACNYQERSFRQAIRDCTEVLELDDTNAKALLRRGLARENIEKFRLAFEDLKRYQELYPGSSPKASAGLNRVRKNLKAKEGHDW